MTSLYTCDRWCMHVYTHTHIYGAQLCLTLCDPMNYSPPGSSVRGILLARILEWATISSPRESSRLTDQSVICYVSCIGRWILYHYHHLGSPYVCVWVYMCVCVCICMHMYIYTYILSCIFFSFYSISRVFSICTILFRNSPTFFSIHICLYKYSPPINKHWAVTYSE